MRIVVALLALAACTGDRFRPIEPGPFEKARAACGPEPDDPRLFVYQAETGECRIDPSRFERRTDRIDIEVRGNGRRRIVIATIDALSDDSIRSERHLFELELRAGAASWAIVSVGMNHRCWEGRGHEDFGTDRCV
jgi:hypothetical protein